MKEFGYIYATTTLGVVSALRIYQDTAKVIDGGTDLLVETKEEILPTYPEKVLRVDE